MSQCLGCDEECGDALYCTYSCFMDDDDAVGKVKRFQGGQ